MKTLLTFGVVFLAGCSSEPGYFERGMSAADPTERGLAYIAFAIFMAAIIRGCLNK